MMPKILLVNPAVFDFTAYDFWLKPYGLLSVAGFLRGKADFALFDYMDRNHSFVAANPTLKSDRWGRGNYCKEKIARPEIIKDIPRYYYRFGLPRKIFQRFLAENTGIDFVFVQTMMTWWYPGVSEVIEDIREFAPRAKVVLGGNYATLCPEHARTLGADFIVSGTDLEPLYKYLCIQPDYNQPAIWEAYSKLEVGVGKLTDGCPFRCTYCSVPKVYGGFSPRPLSRSIAEFAMLRDRGVRNIAFYDDALLYRAEEIALPFFEEVIKQNCGINLHTPNALNARFITPEIADVMVRAGFKTFYLGFESSDIEWQKSTGGKVVSEELATAVKNLKNAGALPQNITAYQILGHPDCDFQQLEESMYYVNSLGIRGMLADYSPTPMTADGQKCAKWIDLSEPLLHNKTVFAIKRLGFEESNRFKDLQRTLNHSIDS